MSTNKNKGLQLLFAAVPLLLSFLISIVSFFAAVFIRGIVSHTDITTDNAANDGLVYLINYLMFVVIFGFLYNYICQTRPEPEIPETKKTTGKKSDNGKTADKKSDNGKTTGKKSDSGKTKSAPVWSPVRYWAKRLPLLLVLGYCIQLLGSAIIAILSIGFPAFFSSYKEMIQSLSGTGIDWMTFVSISFIAPIGEELLFRGVTLHYAKKALPVRGAIIFQAALFGIYHLNIVQLVYATLIGLLLGALAERAGSIVPGIVLHAIINLCSYLVPSVFLDNVPKAAFSAALGLLFTIPCLILLFRRKKKI